MLRTEHIFIQPMKTNPSNTNVHSHNVKNITLTKTDVSTEHRFIGENNCLAQPTFIRFSNIIIRHYFYYLIPIVCTYIDLFFKN